MAPLLLSSSQLSAAEITHRYHMMTFTLCFASSWSATLSETCCSHTGYSRTGEENKKSFQGEAPSCLCLCRVITCNQSVSRLDATVADNLGATWQVSITRTCPSMRLSWIHGVVWGGICWGECCPTELPNQGLNFDLFLSKSVFWLK